MTQKSGKELTLEWFKRVWNNGEQAAIHELMSPNCEVKGLDLPATGPEGFLPFYHNFQALFDDIHMDIFEMIEDDGHIVGHGRFQAMHKKSGNKVDIIFSSSIKWVDGKATEARNVVDFVGMLSQMGELDSELVAKALQA